jgi:hypothetical protein
MAALEDAEKSNLELMSEVSGNLSCCDCKTAKPEWASINLGIMMCLECSGLHRQLGTHISKVRSLKLDSKCWEGALLAHMCSIGNNAFNMVWEANLPKDVLLPQDYPENSKVREAFIFAKYKDHAFFKNEAGGSGVAAECFPLGSQISFEGNVVKLSGGKMFGGNKWDARTLRIENQELIYLDRGKEKGRVPLSGAVVNFVEEDEFAGHPHCLAVQTATTGVGGKDDGRRYVFQCDNDRECVKWVQLLKYAMSSGGKNPISENNNVGFGVAPGIPQCGLGQVVDQLYGNAAQWVETSTIKSGSVRQLGLPNDAGYWHERFLVLTPWCLFAYETPGQWTNPSCSIPLQAAELYDNIRLLPQGAPANANDGPARLGVAFPLGFAVVAFENQDETAEWVAAIKDAIKVSQEQSGGTGAE